MFETKYEYYDNETLLEGYLINHDPHRIKPLVLLAPDYAGQTELIRNKARAVANLGYVAFAIDMYGKNIIGTTKEEKAALMKPFIDDRAFLQRRIVAAYQAVKGLDGVDTNKIAVMGYCFGGLCALDLARSGVDLCGAICIHGQLHAPQHIKPMPIKGKILVLHGYSDPMIKPEQVTAFCNDMTTANVDWEVDMYGHAMHAFTNPQADDPSFGTVYNAKADERSWQKITNFLSEIF